MLSWCTIITNWLIWVAGALVVEDMQFTQPLDANTRPHPIRRSGEGSESESLMERSNIGVIKHEKSLFFGGRVAGIAQCVLTPDADAETLVSI